MKKNISYITEIELKQLNNDLIDTSGGVKGGVSTNLSYIVEFVKVMKNQTLDNISSNLLARIAKGHPFTDGNKRTAYFGARYFLMKNGADFNGCSYLEASEEMEGIAKKPNFKSAYKYAKQLCEEYIVENQMVVPDYETFYRLVIKSMV